MDKDLEDQAWKLCADCGSLDELIDKLCTQDGFTEDDAWQCEMIWDEYWSRHQEGCPDCD